MAGAYANRWKRKNENRRPLAVGGGAA